MVGGGVCGVGGGCCWGVGCCFCVLWLRLVHRAVLLLCKLCEPSNSNKEPAYPGVGTTSDETALPLWLWGVLDKSRWSMFGATAKMNPQSLSCISPNTSSLTICWDVIPSGFVGKQIFMVQLYWNRVRREFKSTGLGERERYPIMVGRRFRNSRSDWG